MEVEAGPGLTGDAELRVKGRRNKVSEIYTDSFGWLPAPAVGGEGLEKEEGGGKSYSPSRNHAASSAGKAPKKTRKNSLVFQL